MSGAIDTALLYDPFAGDIVHPDELTNLRDGMVTTRVAREAPACHMCSGPIAAGERIRHHVAIFNGDLADYRWCALCCAAMRTDVANDNDVATSERYRKRGAA